MTGTAANARWIDVTRTALPVGIVSTVTFAVVATGWETSDGGAFKYPADYWYTALGLPLAAVGLLHAIGVYRLQEGLTGRRGRVGVWINSVCCITLFVQILASLVTASEMRWGPTYPLSALGTAIGLGLLAAGSWRVGLFPRWLLGIWPVVWIAGSFAAVGATPLVLAAYYVAFWVVLTRRTAPGREQ
jgi:hypothetical protein